MRSRVLQILLLLLLPLVRAAIQSVTIDDTFGDLNTGAKPTYLPEGRWQHPDCGGCAIKPPLQQVFMQTYSALTYMQEVFPSMSIEFSFQGTAIDVYFILPNFVSDGTSTETLCNFTLDGELITPPFHHIPSTSKSYEFNSLVFSRENLANKSHTLLISTSGVDRHVFTSFDRAVYQFDDGLDSTNPQPTPTPTIDPPVTASPEKITTTISGTPVVVQSSSTVTQSESPTSSSSSTVSSSSSSSLSSSPSITIGNTSRTLVTTGTPVTTGTVLATSSSLSSTSASGSSTSPNDNNTAHKTPSGAIAGGVVGGVVLILGIVLLLFLCHRRTRAHVDPPSTVEDPIPRHPILIPFTASSLSNPDIETRALEGRPPFTPITKQRDPAQMHAPQNHHSPSASLTSDPETLAAQRQTVISDQINSLKKELDASGSSASGRSRFGGSDVTELLQQNQEMKAEIERLQAQLNSDWALGLTNDAPPGYSRHPADIHRFTSSAAPIAVS